MTTKCTPNRNCTSCHFARHADFTVFCFFHYIFPVFSNKTGELDTHTNPKKANSQAIKRNTFFGTFSKFLSNNLNIGWTEGSKKEKKYTMKTWPKNCRQFMLPLCCACVCVCSFWSKIVRPFVLAYHAWVMTNITFCCLRCCSVVYTKFMLTFTVFCLHCRCRRLSAVAFTLAYVRIFVFVFCIAWHILHPSVLECV